ncbi:hypothetical protein KY361_00795 [Candidatus Woesearchaeota archaeon]|nr:hypothetical protein [Candidatus Woesearchaeota archaeon]
MDEMISRIKEFSSINKNVKQVIMFDQSIRDIDVIKLYNDFGLTREKMEKSMSNYRDVGIILELVKMDEEYNTDWKYYINKFILPGTEPSKFDNILISKDKKMLLLLTNRRLLRVDMRRLNSKIEQINRDITIYNEPIATEPKQPERKGLMGAIRKIFG